MGLVYFNIECVGVDYVGALYNKNPKATRSDALPEYPLAILRLSTKYRNGRWLPISSATLSQGGSNVHRPDPCSRFSQDSLGSSGHISSPGEREYFLFSLWLWDPVVCCVVTVHYSVDVPSCAWHGLVSLDQRLSAPNILASTADADDS